jgi:hypothetical protein
MNSEHSLFWYRVKFLALIAVFLSPFSIGWLALSVFDIRPESGNYGSLVQPVQKIDWPPLASHDGRQFNDGFGRRWTFVIFSGRECGERCFSNLFYMRQIRTLLGKDTMRLQNVLITSAPLNEKLKTYLLDFPNLIVIEDNQQRRLYTQFHLQGLGDVGAEPRMYLVDPDQNLMMHYPPQSDQNRVLEDIKKLMKLSQIG